MGLEFVWPVELFVAAHMRPDDKGVQTNSLKRNEITSKKS